MRTFPEYNKLIQNIEQRGVDVNNEIHGFAFPGANLSFPGIAIHLCLRGTARFVYDMQEITIGKNNLLAIAKLLSAIAMHDTTDLQLRRQILLTQLVVAYEFVNYYRKEQDRQWRDNQTAALYAHFCDLVVAHHREHRDVQFYAAKLGYSTRYLSKLFLKASNGISALDYIGQHVCTRAKRIMDTDPHLSVKATALELGFPTTGNFCRYFKRVTGIYPQDYKKQDN